MSQVDAYPMPQVDDLIDQVENTHYITTLDLTKRYWQVPVAAEDQPKTTFTTPSGLFQFRRMPFGLQGAPATFQHMVDKLQDGNLFWDVIYNTVHIWCNELLLKAL